MRHALPFAVLLASVAGQATACPDGHYKQCDPFLDLVTGGLIDNCVCVPNSGEILEPIVEQTCRASPHYWELNGAAKVAKSNGTLTTYEQCEMRIGQLAAQVAKSAGPAAGDLYNQCGKMVCSSHFPQTTADGLRQEEANQLECSSVLTRFAHAQQALRAAEFDCRFVTDQYGMQRCEETIAAGNHVLRGLSAEGHAIGCETPPTGTPKIR